MTLRPTAAYAIAADTILWAHSYVGADGWELDEIPETAPPNALAGYTRGNERSLLIQDGEQILLVEYEEV